jgi:hypothetical protein
MLSTHPFKSFATIAAVAIGALWATESSATLTLTGNGPNTFTKVVYAVGFPTGDAVSGIAYRTDGKVLVADHINGNAYLVPSHANNTFVSSANIVTTIPVGFRDYLAQIPATSPVGFRFFMIGQSPGVMEINQDGTPAGNTFSVPNPVAVAAYPYAVSNGHTGHLFVATQPTGSIQPAIYEVKPELGTVTTIYSGFQGLGFTPAGGAVCSQDGSILYVTVTTGTTSTSGRVIGLNILGTPTITFDSGDFDRGITRVVAGVGSLGDFVYTTSQNSLWEIAVAGPSAGTRNIIATGLSLGGVLDADPDVWCGPSFPSLLVAEDNEIVRLDPPDGGWTEGTTSHISVSAVPAAPGWALGALGLMLSGAVSFSCLRRRSGNVSSRQTGGARR